MNVVYRRHGHPRRPRGNRLYLSRQYPLKASSHDFWRLERVFGTTGWQTVANARKWPEGEVNWLNSGISLIPPSGIRAAHLMASATSYTGHPPQRPLHPLVLGSERLVAVFQEQLFSSWHVLSFRYPSSSAVSSSSARQTSRRYRIRHRPDRPSCASAGMPMDVKRVA